TYTSVHSQAAKAWAHRIPVKTLLRLGPRLLLAAVPVSAILAGSAWAIGSFNSAIVLQAMNWVAGFIFLALAMETRKPNFEGLLLTGLALPVLALLSANVTVEFAIVGAALVAGWVAAAILKL
ncbi:MAG: hypothetical protein ACREO9_08540, partial [Lysobacterales bacterium]